MNFIMIRDKCVPTLFGQAFDFKAGVPLHVPQRCWDAVQAVGAVPEDELPNPDAEDKKVPEGAEREAAIIAAMRGLVAKGERASFTAAGSPTAPAVSDIVGFTVSGKERDEIWVKAQVSDD